MIFPRRQKIGITVLATTVGITSLLPVNTAVAREKIIFVPPILSSPRRLIPAGTRVYEPSSGENTGIKPELQRASPIAPLYRRQILQDALNGVEHGIDNNLRRPAQRNSPQNEDRKRSSVSVPNQCLQGTLPLTALIPESQVGLTTLSNPTLFFYVPQTSAPELELVVQNENEQEVYTQKYKPSNKAGIISLSLPINSLAVNKQYKWKLSVICNPTDKSQNRVVAGILQRILPDPQLVKKLQQATRQERAVLYASAGIWHDALANVAQIRYLLPNNQKLASDWEGLLTATGVRLNQQIAQQVLIPRTEALQPKKKHKFYLLP